MKKIDFGKALLLLAVNFLLISVITFLFAWWAGPDNTTLKIGPVLGKSLIMSIVFTVAITLFDLKKKQ